jgi:hypothetical protein
MSYTADLNIQREQPWAQQNGGQQDWGRQNWRGPRLGPLHPGLIVLTVIGFILWWPIGLALLAYTLWSKNMGCWGHESEHWQRKMERMRQNFGAGFGGFGYTPSSGNRAFDEYRTETLRRLEEEQREFREFLQRLRVAKDRAEFDQFMAERRNQQGSSPGSSPGSTPPPQS